MNKKVFLLYPLLTSVLLITFSTSAEDLRAYYEKQKAEIAPTFEAPEPGTELSLGLVSGKKCQGTLVKLTSTDVTLKTATGEVTHPSSALAKSSRATLFAADYADAEARKRTMIRKKELEAEAIANTHDGRISVSSKTKTDLDSTKEKTKKKDKTTTTITKTKSVIVELTVTARNKTRHPDTYQLEWFVFSRPIDGPEITTHDHGTEEITVPVGKSLQHRFTAKPITEVSVIKEGKDPKTTGKEKAGYLVLLKHGDTILDKQASSKTFLTAAGIEKARKNTGKSGKRKKKKKK